ncbi:MAG: bifunctional UDP-N-acetylglucosamine diphosphorylase/glucosamine-1-phosphate N-acetyltransferase GlmU [Actinomycetota bacterium]|nr:bifunctional UDP-N-acetylglucosamine diphosphorylase/glucosamine-1-phosphate N-acetyltransferase GlmU [Actinomycetota bacterium]
MTRPAAVVILAAGEGKRMRSATPKVLHQVAGRSLLGHVLEAAAALDPEHVVVVVGNGREAVVAHVEEIAPWALTVVQETQQGTGHAVRIALGELEQRGISLGDAPVVVLTGDTPLLTGLTLQTLMVTHLESAAHATVLTARLTDPAGYGRVIRDEAQTVLRIVEHNDASETDLEVDEVNSGMYCFATADLVRLLAKVTTNNTQGEEYLTDVIGLLRDEDAFVAASLCATPSEILGVNDRYQLAQAAAVMRDRINEQWMRAGVAILDSATTWLDVDVELEPDVTILPNTTMTGPTSVARGARIGPGTTLASCEIGENTYVIHTWAQLAVIGADSAVGPYTYLRPGTVMGNHTKAGAFVEIKNTNVGDDSKVPHLSYVGDGDIGVGSNIGASTVFVNYDGVAKHRTVIGDHVRIGSDTMLVAPVSVGDGAYTAAGSVITEDVPPGAIAIARGQQRNVLDWVLRRRPGSPAAKAAEAAQRNQEEA